MNELKSEKEEFQLLADQKEIEIKKRIFEYQQEQERFKDKLSTSEEQTQSII